MSIASTQLAEALNPSARATMAARGYLARYTGRTLRSYQISLQIFFRYLLAHRVDPLDASEAHLELFVHEHLERERGNVPSSVQAHMGPVKGFYRHAVRHDFISKDPSDGMFLPKIWIDEWRQDWLSTSELQAMLVAGESSDRPSDAGLVAMLALLGLRISEALSVQIEDYSEMLLGHRVLRLIGKGGKPATIPLPPAELRMFNRSAGGRTHGPLLIRDRSSVHRLVGEPLSYRTATIAIDRLAKNAGITRHLTPHMFRRGVITAGLNAKIPIRDMQNLARHSDSRTTSRYDRGAQILDGHAIHQLTALLVGG